MLNEKLQYKSDIELDTLRLYDVPKVAQLYQKAFSDHFLGHMGQNFLQLFCAQFMNSPTNYGYVAKINGKLVGFVFGTIDNEPFSQFYRRNFWTLVALVCVRYFKDAYVRKHIIKRLGNILEALKSLVLGRHREGEMNDEDDMLTPARILAIGVDSNYRGMGIANQLTSHFCARMKQEGFKRVGLSTLPWNKRAIHFYKKDGWILEENTATSLSFIRNII